MHKSPDNYSKKTLGTFSSGQNLQSWRPSPTNISTLNTSIPALEE